MRWRWLFVALVVTLAGGLLLFLSTAPGERWRSVWAGSGVAAISAGVIGLGYELTLRRSVVQETLAIAGLQSSLAKTGVLEISTFGNIDWKGFFESNPGDIQVCVSYAQSWAGSFAHLVLTHAKQTHSRVKITLLDPDGPDHILAFYQEAFQLRSRDELTERINGAVKIWQDATKDTGDAGVRLEIEGLHRPMPYTYYRSGEQMWIVMTPHRPGRTGLTMPAIRCTRTRDLEVGLFDWAEEDLETCRRSGLTKNIWSSHDD